MSITYGTPHKSSYTPVNIELVGKYELIQVSNGANYFGYNFNIKDIPVIELNTDTVYLLERMSVGGGIDENTFLNAVITPLSFNLRYTNTKRSVFPRPIPVLKYSDDRSITGFISSPAGNDLVLNSTGVLEQTQELIGVDEIKLYLTFELFATDSTVYNKGFNEGLSQNIGTTIRGGL